MLLQPGVAELEQIGADQDRKRVDREPCGPRNVDEACHQPGRDPHVNAERARDELPHRLAGALASYLFLQLGRPFLAPPNVPPERVAALRAAFDRTMADAAFLAEAQQMNLKVEAKSGAAIASSIRAIAELPGDIIAKAAQMTRPQR